MWSIHDVEHSRTWAMAIRRFAKSVEAFDTPIAAVTPLRGTGETCVAGIPRE